MDGIDILANTFPHCHISLFSHDSMRYFLPLFFWLIICTVLFTWPGSSLPKTSWLDKIWFDKWVHIGLIASLLLLGAWGFYRYRNRQLEIRTIIYLVIAFSLYGLAMEYVQLYFVKNRSFDNGDVVADVIGAVAGGWFAWWKLRRNAKTASIQN